MNIKDLDKVFIELMKLESQTYAGSEPYVEVPEELLQKALNYLTTLREIHFIVL